MSQCLVFLCATVWQTIKYAIRYSTGAMRKLVICEKSISASRISFILSNGEAKRKSVNKIPVWNFERGGDEYSVIGLRGHIVTLDYGDKYRRWDKVDLKKLATAEAVRKILAPSIVAAARSVVEGVDEIIVATDFDREGELIGVDVLDLLDDAIVDIPKKRARFSALTKHEIETAFDQLTEIDYALAESAKSRQHIDLAWGATLTRFISLATGQRGKDYLSVGRVQSPTLALIVDREREIRSFVPQPFWELLAQFEKGIVFNARHINGRFWEEKEAKAILEAVQSAESGTVRVFDAGEELRRPPPPFDTTTFLLEANKRGYSATRAMRIAEGLYTKGFISYPRTDNTVYPRTLSLRRILEKLKDSSLSKEAKEILALKELKPSRGKKLSTDHPPIHPVAGVRKTKLRGDNWEIYELIVRRFLATLAPDMVLHVSKAMLDIKGEEFESSGTRILKRGWQKYYYYTEVKEEDLPTLAVGEIVKLIGVQVEEDETKPPFRFTQGYLLREMENLGLGTKSTRHEIIQKLIRREYVEGRLLKPTDAGIALINTLEEHANQIARPDMTRTLEEDMLGIAEGEKTLKDVVKESQEMLVDTLDVLEAHKEAIGEEIRGALQNQNLIGRCKECGGDLRILRSRKGSKFIGCSNWPDCKEAYNLPRGGKGTDDVCDACGAPRISVPHGNTRDSICVDPECPSRRLGICTGCGGNMIVKHSKRGRFLGCSNYPDCTNTVWSLPRYGPLLPSDQECKHCNATMVEHIRYNKDSKLICINPDCPSKKKNINKK
jgi:DNA topoisomerase-1